VDEQRLAELFRAAVGEPPPASFDERDIAEAARAADRRHRRTVRGWAAAAACVVALAGLTVGADALFGHGGGGPANGASSATGRQFTPNNSPDAMRPQGRASTAPETTGGCGSADPGLAAALSTQLPAAGLLGPAPVQFPCPADARSAGYQVRDSGITGVFDVVLIPAGEQWPLSAPATSRGSVWDTVTTPGGARLTVLSVPSGGGSTAPFANLVAPIARQLAASR
jgi:hypothetical protein